MAFTRILSAMLCLASCALAAPARASTEADSLRAIHRAQFDRAEYTSSIECAEKEVALRRAEADSLELATALYDLSSYLMYVHDIQRARAVIEESITIRRSHPPVDQELLVDAIWILADALQQTGDFASTERAARDALAIVREIPDPADPRVLYGLFYLARFLRAAGESQEAIELLTEGLVTLEKQAEPSEELIGYRNLLALIYNDRVRYEESAELMRRNYRDCRILYPDDSVRWLEVTANLALTYGFLRRFESADSLLDEVVARAEKKGRQDEGVTRILSAVDSYRGRAATWCGRYDEAGEHLTVYLGSLRARNFPTSHAEVIKANIYLCESRAGSGDFRGAEGYVDSAVAGYESGRLRTGTGTRSVTFVSTPYDTRAICRFELNRPEDAWQDIERARGRLLSDSLLGDPVPFALARVRKALRADEAIVGWVDQELPAGTPRAYGYVIRSTGPVRWERLACKPGERTFTRKQRYGAFRQAIVDAGYSAFGGNDFPGDEARTLWKERFAPLMRHLGGVRTLVVIPSSTMASLPLDALVDEKGTFAGERFAIRQAPSASIYAWLCEQSRGAEKTPRSGLLVGDPPFRAEHLVAWTPAATETASRARVESSTLRSAVKRDPEALGALPRLPWSRNEVETIAGLLPASTTLVGVDASRQALTKLAASGELADFDVIHFATHALVDDIKPERSALVLAQVGAKGAQETKDVGIVTANEIDHWRLHAELVTLSACETALGRDVYGEGTIGFAYPILRAGARCLLASRWPVNDEATALLMERFYTRWLGADGAARMSRADALREAKMWLRTWKDKSGERPYEHPYYWASFVLVGR